MAKAERTALGIGSFISGILISGYFAGGRMFVWVAVFGLTCALLPRTGGILAIVAAGLIGGSVYYQGFFALRSSFRHLPGEKDVARVIVREEPRALTNGSVFRAALMYPHAGAVKVFMDKEDLAYGEVLRVTGALRLPEKTHDLPIFWYPELLERSPSPEWSLRSGLIRLKHAVLRPLNDYLGPRESAFLKALLLGDKSGFDPGFKAELARSGTTHLVALSGFNVHLVVQAVAFALGLFLPRRGVFLSTVAVMTLFVLMVGAEASIVRAAIIGALILLARELGRISSIGHAALGAALMMLLVDPGTGFTLGFQLSFLSFLGIVYLAPVIQALLRPGLIAGEGSGLYGHAIETVSAQIAVAPLLISYFGRVSLIGLLTNILVLSFIPLTMLLGFLLLALGAFAPMLGSALAVLEAALLRYELWVIAIGARAAGPFMIGGGSAVFAAAYYSLITIFVLRSAHVRQA